MHLYTSIFHQLSKHISLTDKEQEEFKSILIEKRLKKKEFLYQPGNTVLHDYYVVKGCLKAYYQDDEGKKHIIQFAIEDWWISDFEALFYNAPAQLYIEAIEDCVLLGIELSVLEELYNRIPKFERFFRIVHTYAFVALRKRILSSLQKTNTQRYIDFCNTYPSIEKRVTVYHIANYLGIQPESLSRIRKELQE